MNYKEFNGIEVLLMDELRIKRNRIAYEGFFINEDYVKRKLTEILKLVEKLKLVIQKKMKG